jgi:hypothetical protein
LLLIDDKTWHYVSYADRWPPGGNIGNPRTKLF